MKAGEDAKSSVRFYQAARNTASSFPRAICRLFANRRDFHMAETTKLSVGRALEKLRGKDSPKSKLAALDEKIGALDTEIQRMRAARRRIERDQQAASNKRD
jgi:hypothetical protein